MQVPSLGRWGCEIAPVFVHHAAGTQRLRATLGLGAAFPNPRLGAWNLRSGSIKVSIRTIDDKKRNVLGTKAKKKMAGLTDLLSRFHCGEQKKSHFPASVECGMKMEIMTTKAMFSERKTP